MPKSIERRPGYYPLTKKFQSLKTKKYSAQHKPKSREPHHGEEMTITIRK